MPAMNMTLSKDQHLLLEIDKTWDAGFKFNCRANIPRVSDWDSPFEAHVLRPHIHYDTCKELREICDIRALEIVNHNRPIKFFWSGGMDSTLGLCSVLDLLKSDSKLTVYYTPESVIESPDFLDHIAKYNVDTKLFNDVWGDAFDPNDLVVTGVIGDDITAGLEESFFNESGDWLYRPWQDFFKFRGMDSKSIELIENKIPNFKHPTNTMLEMRWWFYYAVRHQFWIVKDWLVNLENGVGTNVISFFDTYEFDAWGQMHRNDIFSGPEWRHYKQVFKDVIFQHWNNTRYRDFKTKVNSGFNHGWIRYKNARFDQQFLFIYQDCNGVAKRFKPTYWPIFDLESIKDDLAKIENEF
jgi:hypothetical protein